VTGERRTNEQIRGEIAAEREQLAEALTDLRARIQSKRRLATATATLAAASLAAAASIKLVRRVRG
jgi:hypothetical protein